jgi:hypothetical protein
VAVRRLAAHLRAEAAELVSIGSRTAPATELPSNSGASADRDRERAAALRERAGRVAHRLELLAYELDRGAAWLEQAQLEAQASGEIW